MLDYVNGLRMEGWSCTSDFQEEKHPEITAKAELRAEKLCLGMQTCLIGFYRTD